MKHQKRQRNFVIFNVLINLNPSRKDSSVTKLLKKSNHNNKDFCFGYAELSRN